MSVVTISNFAWKKGDLLTCVKRHVILRASLDRDLTKCILLTQEEKPVAQTDLTDNTVVMALDDQPDAGQRALVRIIHDGNVWLANSNYFRLCNTRR